MSGIASTPTMEHLVRNGNVIDQAIDNLKRELTIAYEASLQTMNTKLKSVIAENVRLNQELLRYAQYVQEARRKEKAILDIYGVGKK